MTLKLIEETPGAALERLVDQAVHLCFSASAIDIEDVAEHGLSGTHAAMIREIRERVDGLLTPAITQDIPAGNGAEINVADQSTRRESLNVQLLNNALLGNGDASLLRCDVDENLFVHG